MNEKKLSIVVPMYNSEEYVERTLLSIFNSDLPRDLYEIVVVNDGSTDSGPDIVTQMMTDYDNLRMVTQENGGLSAARNTGIEQAKGEYIWFVDADDVVLENLQPIENTLSNVSNTLIDVFVFVFEWCYKIGEKKGNGVTHSTVPHDVVISGRDAVLSGYMPSSVCALLIRKEFLIEKQLRFKLGLTQQDVELTYRMMAVAEKVIFKSDIIYNYVIRGGSISHTRTGEKWIKYQSDKVEIISSFYHLADSFKDSDEELSRKIRNHANGALFGCVYNLYKNRRKWKENGVNEAVLAKLKDYHFYPLRLPFFPLKKRLMSWVLNREFLLK